MTMAPTLTTVRLTLRMPRLDDFEPRASFYASDRSVDEGGPLPRAAAWRIWASEVGQWALMGYGPFTVEDRATGAYVGEVGIYHAADAMREMYDMGDAPSCGTCGAIMVRNGSCYRCMSCGSTSGCS